jgi:acetyl esterase/lipase
LRTTSLLFAHFHLSSVTSALRPSQFALRARRLLKEFAMTWKYPALCLAVLTALNSGVSNTAESPPPGPPSNAGAAAHGGPPPYVAPQPVTTADETVIKPLQTPIDYYAIQLQQPPPIPPAPPPGSPPQVIGQYHATRAAAMYGRDQWEEIDGRRTVRNVTRPTITPVLPSPDLASGAAVILVPDGGFLRLEIDKEGYTLARQLADRGVAAIVLKYRTEETPVDVLQSYDAQRAREQQLKSDPKTVTPGMKLLAEDLQDALRVARQRANEMGVDPQRIGVLGFSTAASMVLANALSSDHPAFVASVDGVPTVSSVTENAPPLFLITSDDAKTKKASSMLTNSWRKSPSLADARAYSAKQRSSIGYWCNDFVAWLKERKVMPAISKPAG